MNPSQFAPHEDLDKYPRQEEMDVKLLAKEGVDLVFAPKVSEIYPAGISLHVPEQKGTFVSVEGFSHQMEGAIRPHFFRGVATILTKLFNAIQPSAAFFGQKDVQQCVVTKNLIRDLLFPINLVVVPTMREKDGLAMSSRNRYLSEEERERAPILYKALSKSTHSFTTKGVKDRKTIIDIATDIIKSNHHVELEYLSLADPMTLKELDVIQNGAIFSGAIRVGKTRIIDNLLIGITVEDLGFIPKQKGLFDQNGP